MGIELVVADGVWPAYAKYGSQVISVTFVQFVETIVFGTAQLSQLYSMIGTMIVWYINSLFSSVRSGLLIHIAHNDLNATVPK